MNNIIMTKEEWNSFKFSLEHPTKETIEARCNFLSECNKFRVNKIGEIIQVEVNRLDESDILAQLDN